MIDLSKSHISLHKVLVRFVNLCPVRVSVRWINFSGEEVEYKQVESGGRLPSIFTPALHNAVSYLA